MNEPKEIDLVFTIREAAKLAYDSIRAHKLRSFLTLLGVILGVASVVVVGSAINGLSNYAEESTAKSFGSDNFIVARIASVGGLSRREYAQKIRYNRALRADDVLYLEKALGDRIIFSAYGQSQRDLKFADRTFEGADILGASARLPEIREVTLSEGRFFTEQEEFTRQNVCIIGVEIRDYFFPAGDAIGKTVSLLGNDFTVVGIEQAQGSAFGRSQDKQMYIPIGAYQKIFGTKNENTLFAKARPGAGLTPDEALDLTRVALRSRFHTRPGAADNFDTLTPDAIRGFIDRIIGVISVIVVPVTMISLVVGGIVIMNIMLVSVTERTREIGIRKSIGATGFDIQLQVLMEALMLSLAGGLIGILLAWLVSAVLTQTAGTRIDMSRAYIILGVFVSTGVGLISGWYPAYRAAKLDPIVALRQE